MAEKNAVYFINTLCQAEYLSCILLAPFCTLRRALHLHLDVYAPLRIIGSWLPHKQLTHLSAQLAGAHEHASQVAAPPHFSLCRKNFIETELAKRLGANRSGSEEPSQPEGAEAKRKRLEAELYSVPQELQVR